MNTEHRPKRKETARVGLLTGGSNRLHGREHTAAVGASWTLWTLWTIPGPLCRHSSDAPSPPRRPRWKVVVGSQHKIEGEKGMYNVTKQIRVGTLQRGDWTRMDTITPGATRPRSKSQTRRAARAGAQS